MALCTIEKYINELPRENSSERAQNERQGTLNTNLSRHHCRNSGTWTKGSDRPSGEEIALCLIGWLEAAGAQISRFQEENGLVKWIGTVCARCALFVWVLPMCPAPICVLTYACESLYVWMFVGVFRNSGYQINKSEADFYSKKIGNGMKGRRKRGEYTTWQMDEWSTWKWDRKIGRKTWRDLKIKK